MILTTNNGNKVRLYAGLYMRTKKQTRFWGWGSWGLGKVWRSKVWGGLRTAESEAADARAAEAERPWGALAEWLRLAHAQLDRNTPEQPVPAKLSSQSSLSE
jgi:hypothetical protein